MLYSEFKPMATISDTAIISGRNAIDKLRGLIYERELSNIRLISNVGECKANNCEIIPMRQKILWEKSFRRCLIQRNERLIPDSGIFKPTELLVARNLINGAEGRIIGLCHKIKPDVEIPGFGEYEYFAALHLAAVKASGFDLPLALPMRLIPPWKRGAETVLARCLLTEKGTARMPTAREKKAGLFIDRKQRDYGPLLKPALTPNLPYILKLKEEREKENPNWNNLFGVG
jgi:hypothetical protein